MITTAPDVTETNSSPSLVEGTSEPDRSSYGDISDTTERPRPDDRRAASKEVDVFISYRVSSDQTIASALKDLLESSYEPSPRVFVSGAGGIRPSNVGAIPQIQAAVRQAKAFVAIITKASKEREWIFFEAGAAWGQDKLYVPVMVDTTPDDLPNTIGGYQAVQVSNRSEMEELLRAIGERIGSRLRRSSGARLSTFERRLRESPATEERSMVSAASADSSSNLRGRILEALHLRWSGKHVEADARFETLVSEAVSNEVRADIKLDRIAWDTRPPARDRLEALEELERIHPEVVNNAYFHHWVAELEPRAHQSLGHWRRCLALASANPFLMSMSTVRIGTLLHTLGRTAEGVDILIRGLNETNRDARYRIALGLHGIVSDAPAITQLLLLCVALGANSDVEALSAVTVLATRSGWISLALYWADKFATLTNLGTAWNQLGITLQRFEKINLAYDAYQRAAEAGVSVARVNMASLVSQQAVPSAALKVLNAHVGPFDAATPQVPHEVRAIIERAIHAEQTSVGELHALGERIYHVLCEVAHASLIAHVQPSTASEAHRVLSGDGFRLRESVRDRGSIFTLEFDNGTTVELAPLHPLRHVWSSSVKGVDTFVFNTTNGDLRAFQVELSSVKASLRWLDFAPIISEPRQLTAGSGDEKTVPGVEPGSPGIASD